MFKIKILFYWFRLKIRGRFTSRAELKQYQQKRLAVFRTMLNHSAFFKKAGILKIDSWQKLPLMDKHIMVTNFAALNAPGISLADATDFAINAEKNRTFSPKLKGITVGLSTGTSGTRGVFLVSENERAQWAAAILSRVLHPILFKKQKIAFFLRADSNLYNSVSSSLFQFSYFDIFKPIEQLAKALHQYQPDVVGAQPSILLELCRLQVAGTINIKPKSVVSFAEVLYPEDKATIERCLSAGVKEVYQCTEGFLGCTCSHGTMHLNEDLLLIEKEFIDDTRFHPIVTDFSRSTQFIIRYRLDDILKLSTMPCPCGSATTAVECIEGRSDDVLQFRKRSGELIKIFPDVLSRRIAWVCNDFERYTVRQLSYKEVSISIDCENERYESVKGKFTEVFDVLLQEYLIDNVQLTFAPWENTPRGSKFRKIQTCFEA